MLKFKHATEIGRNVLTVRRMLLAGAAALGLYSFGENGLTYLSTATRLASDGVADQIPVQFELERAKTMIDPLVPDIKRNMIVIAKEEVNVEMIGEEVKEGTAALQRQRGELVKLRKEAEYGANPLRIGGRLATDEEVKEELSRLLTRYKLSEATLGAKQDLLRSRESSLNAARKKLESILNARRDLKVQVENLQARVRAVQSQAIASSVDFDDSQVAKCQELVDSLRVRLQVAERLIAANGEIEDLAATITIGDEDIFALIDEHLGSRPSGDTLAGGR